MSPPSLWTEEERAYLSTFCVEYVNTGSDKKAFYTNVWGLFLRKFPVMPTEDEILANGGDVTKAFKSAACAERRAKRLASATYWFQNNAARIAASLVPGLAAPVRVRMLDLSNKEKRKPQLPHAWLRLFYHKPEVQAAFNVEWKNATDAGWSVKRQAALRNKWATDQYHAADTETKALVDEYHEKGYLKDDTERYIDVEDGDDDDMIRAKQVQEYLDNLPHTLRRVAESLHKQTGWHFSITCGGRLPRAGGDVNTMHLSIGRCKQGLEFSSWNSDQKTDVANFRKFCEETWSKDECLAMSLTRTQPVTVAPITSTSASTPHDIDNSAIDPELMNMNLISDGVSIDGISPAAIAAAASLAEPLGSSTGKGAPSKKRRKAQKVAANHKKAKSRRDALLLSEAESFAFPESSSPPVVPQAVPPPVAFQVVPPPIASQAVPPPVAPPPVAPQVAPPPIAHQAVPPPVAPQIVPPPVASQAAPPPVAPQAAPPPVASQAAPPPVAPQAAPHPVASQVALPPVVPQATPPPVAPQVVPPSVAPQAVLPPVAPQAAPPPVALAAALHPVPLTVSPPSVMPPAAAPSSVMPSIAVIRKRPGSSPAPSDGLVHLDTDDEEGKEDEGPIGVSMDDLDAEERLEQKNTAAAKKRAAPIRGDSRRNSKADMPAVISTRKSSRVRKVSTKLAGSEGSALDTTLPIVELVAQVEADNSLPDYFTDAVKFMGSRGYGCHGEFLEMLKAFVVFENKFQFIERKTRTKVANRPGIIKTWMTGENREFDEMKSDNPVQDTVGWFLWWATLQPKWHQAAMPHSRTPPPDARGFPELKNGRLGVVTVVASLVCLYFSTEEPALRQKLAEGASDVCWALTVAATGVTANEDEEDQPARKRPRL
ncbi:hypothetical protein PUNSTDRAFT_133653 [Punctularia strigosozonata HHB-11173 SS5]|uniref:uncharacterized protein n=1 Tax=Punctularia strigosozonata (strain HHB-11173) TaxID=741275 RepID=UPI0004417697|nr:uncharacterized protein PUNSTDRAFT_133653 [Punctularia strigosozonata HHB-11173 SS5]EIN09882.1 hypothetical protein PUNSTDRAFT_133653 [Punctularia strigosozonata HHB-11173 SS5]